MARQEIMFDDLDFNATTPKQTVADVTIEFSYRDGTRMRVDLTSAHAEAFDKVMERYVAVASEVPDVPVTRTRANRSAGAGNGSSSSPVWSDGTPLTRDELRMFRTWDSENDGDNRIHKYDGGGYSYPNDLVREFEAVRNAPKTDDTPPADPPKSDA